MSNIMRISFICFFVCLAVFSEGFLDTGRLAVAGREVTLAVYPDADYAVVDNRIETVYNGDATCVTVDDTAVKILTEAGRKNNRMLREYYNKAYSTSAFTLIQIISPDGTVKNINPGEVCNETIDTSQMQSNIYDPAQKILTAGIPGLKINDIIRYVVRRNEYKVRMPGAFGDYFVLEYGAPIVRTTLQVKTPASLPLVHKEILSPVKGTVSYTSSKAEDGGIVHKWALRDVPMAMPEPQMPKMYTCVQRLLISNIEKWEDISRWYWKLSEPHFKCNEEMKAKIAELTAGVSDEMAKADAIFRFVSQEIRYMGETTEKEAPGYEPHDAAVTFGKRHGVCRDKAALLTAMLRAAGLEAFPVLIHSGPKKDMQVPQPFFNHAITAVRDKAGKYRLMDSTDENTADWLPAYLDNKSFLVATPEGETLMTSPIRPANENMMSIRAHCDINADGTLSGYAFFKCSGINDNAYRGSFAEWHEEERRMYMERVIRRTIPGGRITRLKITPEDIRDINSPFSIEISFEAPGHVVRRGEYAYVPCPSFIGNFGIANWMFRDTSLDKRRFPLVCSFTAAGEETLTLSIAPEWGTLAELPKYSSVDDGCFEWSRKASFNGNLFTAKSRNAVKTMEFTPEQYLKLKGSLKAMSDDFRRMLIFIPGEKRALPDTENDTVVLESRSDIVLESDSHYTRTDLSSVLINTYNGLKSNSDLAISYCPDFEELEVVYAKVFNGDKCTELDLKELKVMDGGWTASAPKYPRLKTVVINFPSVKVGSIVECKTVRKYRGDAPFSLMETFAGFSPVMRKTVSVKVPESLDVTLDKTEMGYFLKGDAQNISENVESGNGFRTYTWVAVEQKPLKREVNLPLLRFVVPTVAVHTASWKDVAERLDTVLRGKIGGGKRLASIVDRLAPYDKMRQVRALKTYISRNVRIAGPGLGEIPLDFICSPEKTLEDGYGSRTDTAVLYFTLLNMLGMEPEFVFASGRMMSPETVERVKSFVSWNTFTVPLIRVNVDGTCVWLNDDDQYAELGTTNYDGHIALYRDGSIQNIELEDRFRTKEKTDIGIELQDNGDAVLKVDIVLHGRKHADYRELFAEQTPEERRRYLLEHLASFSTLAVPIGELVTDFEKYPGRISYSGRLPCHAVIDGDYAVLRLASPFAGLLAAGSDVRTLPYEGISDSNFERNVRVTFPREYEIVLAPESERSDFPGKKSFVLETDAESGMVELKYSCALSPFMIDANEYGRILDFNRRASHPAFNGLVLRKKK